jgi:hypothetical protein
MQESGLSRKKKKKNIQIFGLFASQRRAGFFKIAR